MMNKNSATILPRAKRKTYSTRSSLVVTDPATIQALEWLPFGDQTGSRFVTRLWPYMLDSQFIRFKNDSAFCGRELDVHATLKAVGDPRTRKTAPKKGIIVLCFRQYKFIM